MVYNGELGKEISNLFYNGSINPVYIHFPQTPLQVRVPLFQSFQYKSSNSILGFNGSNRFIQSLQTQYSLEASK